MFFIKFFVGTFVLNVAASSSDLKFPEDKSFEYCDHLVPLGPGRSLYINSPYYPKKYMPNSSCRYTITAPLDYEINLQCNVNVDKGPNGCTTETFYVSAEGDRDIKNGEYFCGKGYIQRKSFFQTLVLAYTSNGTNTGGVFSCFVETQPQACECGWSIENVENRINKGEEAVINEYPFVAALINSKSGRVFCGGTIISHRFVMTAASCFNVYATPKDIEIRVGEHNLNIANESPYTGSHSISAIIQHPMYDPKGRNNDIALALTLTNIQWSSGVGPACLPFFSSFNPFAGTNVNIVGWGTTEFMGPPSDILRKVTVNVTSNEYCRSIYSEVDDSQICTYSPPKDACLFDAGGPLVLRDNRLYSIGITGMTSSCGLFLPSVHTRVTSYLNWISSVVGNGLCMK